VKIFVSILVFLAMLGLRPANAEEPITPGFVIGKYISTLKSPITLAPAIADIISNEGDWYTSQRYFRAGIWETNEGFTVDGKSPGQPISFGQGNWIIAGHGLKTLGISVFNSGSADLVADFLSRRYPIHKKFWRRVALVEKIAYSSYLGYQSSASHWKQWGTNMNGEIPGAKVDIANISLTMPQR
jgi:hypothetical protein